MPDFLKGHLRSAAVILGIAALLTFFGVYTTDGALWVRYLMWVVTCTAGGIASAYVIPLVFERRIAGPLLPVQVLVGAALISLPVLATLYLFLGAFGYWAPVHTLPLQFVYVYAVTLVLTLIGVLIARASRHAPAPAAAGETADPARRFLGRLPPKYREAGLWAVSSEDHYLRVHTSLGEELILMRLADAMRELAGADGVQAHRSWWVAKDGVGDAKRDNGKLVLVLKSGTEVPVSRTYAAAVREAGLA